MGPVTLAVANLGGMVDFYRDGVGLEVLSESPGAVTLGHLGADGAGADLGASASAGGQTEIVKLTLQPDLKPDNPAAAGLYHLAILFPTKSGLAASVNSVAQKFSQNFSGSADHLVSQAFYFTDPEGNGVELYWDRDESEWPRTGEYIRMATLPLDPAAFLRENLWAGEGTGASAPARTSSHAPASGPVKLGHVHLRVGDLAQAEDFYVNKVGFDKTFQFGDQALFVSVGGYHHHLGMNTWQSGGAGQRTPARGLAMFEIFLPSDGDVVAMRKRLEAAGIATEPATSTAPAPAASAHAFTFADPWLNKIRVAPANPG